MNLFKRLVYIYIGTDRFDEDFKFYKDVLGARLLWEFENFGARVAGFDLCGEPYLLIADHVRPPSKRLIYEVESLAKAEKELEKRGWKKDSEKFDVPDGSCYNFRDKSGNEYAILEMTRPFYLNKEYKKKKD